MSQNAKSFQRHFERRHHRPALRRDSRTTYTDAAVGRRPLDFHAAMSTPPMPTIENSGRYGHHDNGPPRRAWPATARRRQFPPRRQHDDARRGRLDARAARISPTTPPMPEMAFFFAEGAPKTCGRGDVDQRRCRLVRMFSRDDILERVTFPFDGLATRHDELPATHARPGDARRCALAPARSLYALLLLRYQKESAFAPYLPRATP